MAVPMRNGGMSAVKVIILVILSGVTTGIRSLLRKCYRKGFRGSNSYVLGFCSRFYVIYSNR